MRSRARNAPPAVPIARDGCRTPATQRHGSKHDSRAVQKTFSRQKISATGRFGENFGRANPRLRIFFRQNKIHPRHRGKNPLWRDSKFATNREIVRRRNCRAADGSSRRRALDGGNAFDFPTRTARRFARRRFWRSHWISSRLQKTGNAEAEGAARVRRKMEAASHDGGVVSLVRGGCVEEKEVTPRFASVIKFSLGGKFPEHLMNKKNPNGIGPVGRWSIFFGIPVALLAILLVSTLHHGLNQIPKIVGEAAAPYVVFFTPVIIGIVGMVLYEHFPKRLVIPLGIVGWIVGLSLIFWYFWFGPGAFGHH